MIATCPLYDFYISPHATFLKVTPLPQDDHKISMVQKRNVCTTFVPQTHPTRSGHNLVNLDFLLLLLGGLMQILNKYNLR